MATRGYQNTAAGRAKAARRIATTTSAKSQVARNRAAANARPSRTPITRKK